MSVINQMLQDLERRRGQTPADVTLQGVRSPGAPGRRWSLYVAGGMVAVTLTAAAAFAMIRPQAPTPVPAAVMPPAQPAQANRDTAPPPDPEPTPTAPALELQAVGIEPAGDATRLVLQLSGPFEYAFDHDPEAGRIALRIPEARLGAIPDLGALSDTPIRGIQADDGDGGVRLQLELRTPVLTRIHGQRSGRPARLVLEVIPDPAARTVDQTVAPEQTVAEAPVEEPPASAVTPAPAEAVHIQVTRRESAEDDAPAQVLAAARTRAAAGDVEGAIDRLSALLARAPKIHGARELLARLLIRSERMSEAGAVLQAGLILAPGHMPFAVLQARLLVDRGDLVEAARLLDEAVQRSPGDAEAHAFLAGVQARRGAHDMAARHYRLALRQQPARGMWWLGLGIALEGQQDWSGALDAYRRARASGTVGGESLRFAQRRIAAIEPLGRPVQARNP